MAHSEQSTTPVLDRDLHQALGAAIAATVLAGLLIGALALFMTQPAPVIQEAAAPVTDGWMSYLAGHTAETEVVDGWSSYLTLANRPVGDGWQSYLGAAAQPDVIDGWMSRYGEKGD